MPSLTATHGTTQLSVGGKPILMLGGELGNSTAADRAWLNRSWAKLAAMHLNTVLSPVYWELIEPEEGKFDFSSVDDAIDQARKHDMHLVLLWFGSWKNSMSIYAPSWVKRDKTRFPRVLRSDGGPEEILSPLSQNNLDADIAAYRALMTHVKQKDGSHHTVLMIQVENEIGMLPEARDHSPAAEAAFKAAVPKALTDYLAAHRDALRGPLKAAWLGRGAKAGASWTETFGPGVATDEIFNAWVQARYAGKVAAAGRAIYPLPTYVNAALIRPGRAPGAYPSGGPLPHLFDVWKAAAPAIDVLAPDVYFPDFADRAEKYVFAGNPLIVPETGRVSAQTMSVNAFYAFGALNAIGFSPFAIEDFDDASVKTMGAAYGLLRDMMPVITAHQGTGTMTAFRPAIEGGYLDAVPQQLRIGPYVFSATPSPGAKMPGGLIVQTGPEDFFIAGSGLDITFAAPSEKGVTLGIDVLESGHFRDGRWVAEGRLNGDQSNQGRQVMLPGDGFSVQHLRLYRY